MGEAMASVQWRGVLDKRIARGRRVSGQCPRISCNRDAACWGIVVALNPASFTLSLRCF
jgi:hypothetical protein